jgi:hypothetical protein
MLATSDLHRSIAKMTLSLARDIDAHKHRADDYKLCEREHQFQIALSGTIGATPAETSVALPFYIYFVADPGYLRDSDLSAPQVRFGFEIPSGPSGLVPYAHVQQWSRNNDMDYTGAQVTVGVHCPAMLLPSADTTVAAAFTLVLHAAFQGYGCPWDADGPNDGGGT